MGNTQILMSRYNLQFLKQKIGDRNLIRQYNEGDIDTIIQLWLDTNIQAHHFISSDYWRANYDMVREMLPHAEIYVYEDDC